MSDSHKQASQQSLHNKNIIGSVCVRVRACIHTHLTVFVHVPACVQVRLYASHPHGMNGAANPIPSLSHFPLLYLIFSAFLIPSLPLSSLPHVPPGEQL